MKDKKIKQASDQTKKNMLQFFLKTSVPRIIAEKKKANERSD
jgi:hypothetical protein